MGSGPWVTNASWNCSRVAFLRAMCSRASSWISSFPSVCVLVEPDPGGTRRAYKNGAARAPPKEGRPDTLAARLPTNAHGRDPASPAAAGDQGKPRRRLLAVRWPEDDTGTSEGN